MNDKLITENMGLVHMCAKRFNGRGTDYEDIFQIGCVGLIKAAKKFDESRGLKFSTYAVPVIIGEIKGFFRSDGIVKVSRGIKELAVKINKLVNSISNSEGYIPTVSQIAEMLNEDVESVATAMSASTSAVSLTIGSEDGESQFDIPIESRESEITERLSLEETLKTLDESDKKLIELRYFKNKTQTEVAKIFDCSQVQVSRREKKLLLIIREKLSD